jgi:hypothetical protein
MDSYRAREKKEQAPTDFFDKYIDKILRWDYNVATR